MKLIVALGNPGLKYEKTKHNTGFMALDHYLDEKGLRLDRDKFTALYAKEKVAGEDVIFMEPQTYMNESGRAVGAAAKFFKIDPSDILVIHDDMDMPIAKLRIRAGGKSGGHNGIKSIIACLGTEKFNRLRIGIRHPDKQSVVSWVLTPFNPDQQKELEASFAKVDQIIDDFIAGKDAQYLMNRYN